MNALNTNYNSEEAIQKWADDMLAASTLPQGLHSEYNSIVTIGINGGKWRGDISEALVKRFGRKFLAEHGVSDLYL